MLSSRDAVIRAEAQSIAASFNNPPRKAGQKSAVEIMRELSNAFFGIAAINQPKRNAAGEIIGGDLEKFRIFGAEAAAIAGRLAPFEGPTYASVRVTQAPADLSKLTDEELATYEQLARKSAPDGLGDSGGASPPLN